MKLIAAFVVIALLLVGGWVWHDRQTRTQVRVINDSGAPVSLWLFWNDTPLDSAEIAMGGDWTFSRNMPGHGTLRLSWTGNGELAKDLGYVTRNRGQRFAVTIYQEGPVSVSVDGRPAPG
ncbi:MAG: hypothetical protein WA979_10405 [Pacificimonas sp.]